MGTATGAPTTCFPFHPTASVTDQTHKCTDRGQFISPVAHPYRVFIILTADKMLCISAECVQFTHKSDITQPMPMSMITNTILLPVITNLHKCTQRIFDFYPCAPVLRHFIIVNAAEFNSTLLNANLLLSLPTGSWNL